MNGTTKLLIDGIVLIKETLKEGMTPNEIYISELRKFNRSILGLQLFRFSVSFIGRSLDLLIDNKTHEQQNNRYKGG